jgi:hypothetical protein
MRSGSARSAVCSVLTVRFLLTLMVPAEAVGPPPNDDIDAALAIEALPFAHVVDTRGATQAPDDPACHGAGPTVWYTLTLPTTTYVQVDTAGDSHHDVTRYDATVSVSTGTRGALTRIACEHGPFDVISSTYARFLAEAGETYHVMVGAYGSGRGGILALNVWMPLPSDDIGAAAPITALPFSEELDITGATAADDDPWLAPGGPSVWYALTLPRDTLVEVVADGDGETSLSAWTGRRGELTLVSSDPTGPRYGSTIQFTASAGTTYHLMILVSGDGWVGLEAHETALPPANDHVDTATPITALPFSDELDTRGATEAPDDPDCHGAGPTVWYALTLEQPHDVGIDTFGSSYDTTLSAYVVRADRPELLERIACNDDTEGLQSRIAFAADADTTYFVMVAACGSGEGGDLVLTATGAAIAPEPRPPTPSPTPVPTEVHPARLPATGPPIAGLAGVGIALVALGATVRGRQPRRCRTRLLAGGDGR